MSVRIRSRRITRSRAQHRVHRLGRGLAAALCTVLALAIFFADSTRAEPAAAIRKLTTAQDAGSGWGQGGQRARTSALSVRALGTVSSDFRAVTTGRLALAAMPAPTSDAEAQRVLAGVGDGSILLATRNAADPVGGRPNAAEGGWGIAPGFASDVLDTALALRALSTAGIPLGLDLVDETVSAGAFDQFSTDVPSAATTITALVQSVDAAGQIQVRVTSGTPPTLSDPFFNLTGPIAGPLTLTGIPFAPGTTYFLRIDGVAASSLYSIKLEFSGPGVDSAAVSEPLAYLRAAQNPDGGFGLQPSDDSLVGTTAEALLASQSLPNQATPDEAAAIAFLEGLQAFDGSFGTASETALAYLALFAADPGSAAALSAYNYLVGAQLADGSWGGSDAETSQGLLALLRPPSSLDSDGDGLTDAFETAIGFNPGLTDSDSNGTLDGDEDSDGDGLSQFAEQALGSDALLADGDGDGIMDGVELANGGDPAGGFVEVDVPSGFSLFAVPASVTPGDSAFDLLMTLGVGGPAEEVARLDPLTGVYERAAFTGGIPTGIDFPLSTAEGYAIKISRGGRFAFPGAPDAPTIDLEAGLNLIGLPSAPAGLTAFTLLQSIGDDTIVQSLVGFDPDQGAFESATYESGLPVGVNFPIERGRGYFVSMRQALVAFAPPLGPMITIDAPADGSTVATTTVDVVGTIDPSATTVDVNGVGAQISPGQYTALAVPLVLGANTLTATASDAQGLLGMDTAQVVLNFAPQISITSPLDQATLTSSPVVVSGTVMDDEAVSVAVNGFAATVNAGTFSASVPLSTQGSNLLTAVATDTLGGVGVDSITVTLSSVDYSIPLSGSVNDSRIFTGAQALLDQTAFFTESQIGVPAGVTYTTTGVARISATEFQVDFNIAVGAGTALGTYSFQVDYGLLDAGSNPLVPLSGDVFDFAIEVLP